MFYTSSPDEEIREKQQKKLCSFIAYVKKERTEYTPYDAVNETDAKDGFYYVPAPNYRIKNGKQYFNNENNRVTFQLHNDYDEKKAKELLRIPKNKNIPTVYTKSDKLEINNNIVHDYLEIVNQWNEANLPINEHEYFLIVTKRKAIVFNYDAVMYNYKQITDLSRWWCVPTSVD